MATITQKAVRRMRTRYGVTVLDRHQWTANPWSLTVYGVRRRTRKHSRLPGNPVDTLWAHISVTRLETSSGRKKTMKEIAQEIHNIGQQRFGTGTSYNMVLHPHTGEMSVGQAFDAAGAHTLNDKGIRGFSFNQNYVALAICTAGMPGIVLSDKAMYSFASAYAALQDVAALTNDPDFEPHSLVAAKDCPTDGVRDKMPEIVRLAKKLRTMENPQDLKPKA